MIMVSLFSGCSEKSKKTDVIGIIGAMDVEVSTLNFLGFAKGEIPYTGEYAFPADAYLRSAAVEAVKECTHGIHVFEGRICSGDQFISETKQKDTITSNFGGNVLRNGRRRDRTGLLSEQHTLCYHPGDLRQAGRNRIC